jgi:hypothetical protein
VRQILGEHVRLYVIRGGAGREWAVFWVVRIPHRLVIRFVERGVVKDIGKYRLTIRDSGGANPAFWGGAQGGSGTPRRREVRRQIFCRTP